MITINLLPIGAFKEKFKGRVFLAAYAIAMLIAVAALFSIKTNVMDGNLEALRANQASQQSRLGELQKQVTEATAATARTVQQWQQLTAIMELEERRRDQTRLLVQLEQLLPKSDAWFLSLSHDKGVLTLEAISRDKETVSQFLKRLEDASYIDKQSVNLLEITQNMVINGIKLTKFKVSAKTVFPFPEVIEDGLPDYGLPGKDEFIKAVEAAAPALADKIKAGVAQGNKTL